MLYDQPDRQKENPFYRKLCRQKKANLFEFDSVEKKCLFRKLTLGFPTFPYRTATTG